MPLEAEGEARTITYADRAASYDFEYYEDSDHPFLSSLIAPAIRSVLEIPCGAGNNTLHLARPDLRLVAADLEPAMIERLRERIADDPRFRSVVPVVADMTDLNLGETFEAIVVQREAFQMVPREQAARALSGFKRHLAPGGFIMIDLASFAPCDAAEARLQPRYFDATLADGIAIPEWTKTFPAGEVVSRSRVQSRSAGHVRVDYDYRVRHPDGREERWRMELPLVVYSRAELVELARSAGLRAVQTYRDYDRRPYVEGAPRLVFILTHAPATEDLVGWIKEAAAGFSNERDSHAVTSFADEALRPERLAYFGAYFDEFFNEAFIPGMGAEAILEALRSWGRGGDWLDLGAGTTTLFWAIPMAEVRSITCADIVVEALAVLADFARSSEIPGCYRDALRMLARPEQHVADMRAKMSRYLVLDTLSEWPSSMRAERFDLITAIGNFGMATGPEHYRACVRHAGAHLADGGRLIGADWLRRPEFSAQDGHDNAYLSEDLLAAAATEASLELVHCVRADVAGDPHYHAILVWVMER